VRGRAIEQGIPTIDAVEADDVNRKEHQALGAEGDDEGDS
jgi:hypothetical protein